MRRFWHLYNIPEWYDSVCFCFALITPLGVQHVSFHPDYAIDDLVLWCNCSLCSPPLYRPENLPPQPHQKSHREQKRTLQKKTCAFSRDKHSSTGALRTNSVPLVEEQTWLEGRQVSIWGGLDFTHQAHLKLTLSTSLGCRYIFLH